MAQSLRFYQDLPALTDFKALHQTQFYHKVPSDWWIVIADIKASTKAIEMGQYRLVNTIGAAAIAVAQAALPNSEVLSVFGGDGASFLVPPEHLAPIKEALLGLKGLALNQHNLTLRVGALVVSEIRQWGFEIEVAKLDLGAGKTIPLIRGGGLSYADEKIKAEKSTHQWNGVSSHSPELSSLSCRWQPLPSERGKILTLLVKSTNYDNYQVVLENLETILGENWGQASPVKTSNMKYKNIAQILTDEWRLQKFWPLGPFIKRLASITLSVLAFRWKLPMPFNVTNYVHQTRQHSDFRKFDDMIRLVIDCTEDEINRILEMLDRLHGRGDLFYGTQISDEALMTCLVQNLDQGGHIHFIDGSGGGYSLAAVELKKQIAQWVTLQAKATS